MSLPFLVVLRKVVRPLVGPASEPVVVEGVAIIRVTILVIVIVIVVRCVGSDVGLSAVGGNTSNAEGAVEEFGDAVLVHEVSKCWQEDATIPKEQSKCFFTKIEKFERKIAKKNREKSRNSRKPRN